MIKVLFFARVKEELDCACLDIAWQADIADLDSLQAYLCRRGGPRWQEVLNRSNMIRAINQAVANDKARIDDGDEVAFFPPVTGG
ncbi:MAG: molybdopterin converting factor subunit 1 [Halioglobus sp.]|nr:molybdopterin converting factor subunit 1 [Halioglobus sp.]